MEKRQVLLIQMQPLLGEGVRRILEKLEDIQPVCLDCQDLSKIDALLIDVHPVMVILAGEKEDDRATHLISSMLKQFEDVPIVWIELETNVLRVFTAHSLSANSAELIQAIRDREVNHIEFVKLEKKTHPGNWR